MADSNILFDTVSKRSRITDNVYCWTYMQKDKLIRHLKWTASLLHGLIQLNIQTFVGEKISSTLLPAQYSILKTEICTMHQHRYKVILRYKYQFQVHHFVRLEMIFSDWKRKLQSCTCWQIEFVMILRLPDELIEFSRCPFEYVY